MPNLNTKQLLSIVLAVLGVLIASTAQLNDLLGPTLAKTIVTISSLVMSMLSAINIAISTQSSLIQDVQAMPGVEKITVNAQANSALATLAVDPAQDKIEATPQAAATVAATAKGA